MKRASFLYISLLAFTLAACGGGGGGSTNPPGGNNPPPGGNNPPANNPPVANIAAVAPALELSEIALDGSTSSDADGDTLGYAWTQTGGTPVELDGANTATPTFRAPKVETSETLAFELSVTDGEGGSDTATIEVTVTESDVIVFSLWNGADQTYELYMTHDALDAPLRLSPEQASDHEAYFEDFSISPDRRQVAFIADLEFDDVHELYVAALDGSGVRKVSGEIQDTPGGDEIPDGSVLSFAWSPDSQWLAFRGDLGRDGVNWLYTVRLDDDTRYTLGGLDETIDPTGVAGVSSYSWRPQGDLLALGGWADPTTSYKQLYLVGRDQEDPANYQLISGNTDRRVAGFTASPDGETVAWMGILNASGYRTLFVTDIVAQAAGTPGSMDGITDLGGATTNFQNGNSPLDGGVTVFTWSPTGDRLAFFVNQLNTEGDLTSGFRGCGRIFTVLADGSEEPQLVIARENNNNCFKEFQFSPNGERLAVRGVFTSLFPLSERVYIDGLPKSTGHTESDVKSMFWSPDSQYLAYVGDLLTAGRNELFVKQEGLAQTRLSPSAQNGEYVYTAGLQWAPDSSEIAYQLNSDSDGDGTADVWTLRAATPASVDGSESVDLRGDVSGLPDPDAWEGYHWTHDGHYIVFSGDMDADEYDMLYRTERASGERELLSAGLHDRNDDSTIESAIDSYRLEIAGPPAE